MELRLDQRQSLSASWLLRLVREAGYEVPQTSLSTAPFIIGRPDGFHITVTPQDNLTVDHRGLKRPVPPGRGRRTGSAQRRVDLGRFGVRDRFRWPRVVHLHARW